MIIITTLYSDGSTLIACYSIGFWNVNHCNTHVVSRVDATCRSDGKYTGFFHTSHHLLFMNGYLRMATI